MDKELIPETDTVVKKSNVLCRSAWGSDSIWEARIVAIVASKVHKDDKDFKSYILHVSDIITATEANKGGGTYKMIDEMTDKAMSRVVKIKDPEGWTKYNLFSRCRYKKKEGTLDIRLHPDLVPHYLNLKKKFTQYKLAEFLSLPSSYSQRIYEILRSWDDCVVTEISIQDLHEMLQTPITMQKNFAEFKRRALNKAHKDITTKTTLKYEWEAVKKGRKIVKVRFVFGKQSKVKIKNQKKQVADHKQSTKNNRLFIEAVKCASDYNNDCRKLRGTKKCCSVCMQHTP